MIELKNINGGYGKKQVLFDINTIMRENEITSIIGPNGCGKSTLLEISSGLMKPYEGVVVADGVNIHEMNAKDRAKKISVLSQQKNPGALTVRALVYHGRFPYLGYPRKYRDEDRKTVDEAMRTAGIYDLADESLAELSGGQQQKAYIAMLLAQNTDIVFLDEPVTFLDINYQLELMEIIKELKNDGKTVIMVIHDINLAMSYSDKIIAMKNGRIVFDGKPKKMCESNVLESIFGIKANYSYENRQYFFTRIGSEI